MLPINGSVPVPCARKYPHFNRFLWHNAPGVVFSGFKMYFQVKVGAFFRTRSHIFITLNAAFLNLYRIQLYNECKFVSAFQRRPARVSICSISTFLIHRVA